MEKTDIDVKENLILSLDAKILTILLKDQTSKKNIIWATDIYSNINKNFTFHNTIKIRDITGKNGEIIKPRVIKSLEIKQERSRNKGEVFTPSWICNQQNNLINKHWFVDENPFNTEDLIKKTWITNQKKIKFLEDKTWKEYVNNISLEVTCGEAPYITSRYDTVTGKYIDVKDRIGILDRKLRIIRENVSEKEDWYEWAIQALKSTYGFEWQGDNLILARENIFASVIEHYDYVYNEKLSNEQLENIATIISWNIWQMDGLKYVIPNSCSKKIVEENKDGTTIIHSEGCPACYKKTAKITSLHDGIYCKIKNWKTNKNELFVDTLK